MASTVTTRRADENLRRIALIGYCSHQIVGAKLPSNRQVLQTLFYNTRFVKLNAKDSAKLTIDSAIIFWQQARIPVRRSDKCIDKLVKLHTEWEYLQKRQIEEMGPKMKERYDDFMDNLDNLFDIAHANALTMMRNDEDIQFLEKQRENGRPGSMLGIDQKLAGKEDRSRLRKEKEEARKLKHAQAQASSSTAEQSGE